MPKQWYTKFFQTWVGSKGVPEQIAAFANERNLQPGEILVVVDAGDSSYIPTIMYFAEKP